MSKPDRCAAPWVTSLRVVEVAMSMCMLLTAPFLGCGRVGVQVGSGPGGSVGAGGGQSVATGGAPGSGGAPAAGGAAASAGVGGVGGALGAAGASGGGRAGAAGNGASPDGGGGMVARGGAGGGMGATAGGGFVGMAGGGSGTGGQTPKALSFVRSVNYPFAGGATSVALGDFNRDGLLDIVMAGWISGDGPISLMLGGDSGTFAAPVARPEVGRSVVVADFNRDGKLDVAFLGGAMVRVLIGAGDGTFAAPVAYAAGSAPGPMAVADLNGDLYPDLAIASVSPNANGMVAVLMNAGNGTFGSPRTHAVGLSPTGIAIGDLNRDGLPDIVVACQESAASGFDAPNVLINKGGGTFLAAVSYPMTSCCYSTEKVVVIGDVNGDGSADIVASNGVLLNSGRGTFTQNAASVRDGPMALGDLDGDGTLDFANAFGDVVYNRDSGLLGTPNLETFGVLGVDPKAIALGDLNRDGKLDLVIATDGGISTRLNLGRGGFLAPAIYPGAGRPSFGDLNGDGKLDMAVTSPDGGVYVFLNNGEGSLSTPETYDATVSPGAVVIGDLNGDGAADLAAVLPNNGGIRILVNQGKGTFAAAVGYAAETGAAPRIVARDLDGDGRLDLILGAYREAYVTILLNKGDAVFADVASFSTGLADADIALEDLNGDARPDLAVVNGHEVSVSFNKGDGTFLPAVTISTAQPLDVIAARDLNGDGYADLAVTGFSDGLRVFLNDGKGAFAPGGSYDADTGTSSIALEDLNGDGRPDVVTGSATGFSTFLNKGNGAFAAAILDPVPYPVPSPVVLGVSSSVATADLNGDGRPEVIFGDTEGIYGQIVFLNPP